MKRLLLTVTILLAASQVWAAGGKGYVGTTAPATCEVGNFWIDTDGTVNDRFYTCTAANTWTKNSGGDNLGSAAYSDVVALWPTCTGYLKSDGTCDTPSGSATYPSAAGVANWNGSAWGTSYTLDIDLSTTSASDDTLPSAKSVKALVDALPLLTIQTYSITTGANNILGSNYGLIADTDGDGYPQVLDSAVTIPDSGTLIFDESASDPNDADVVLSGTDGVLKIAAANGANNEDLTIDLDATANKAKIASSTALSLITTSTIPLNGAIRTVGKDSDYTIGTDDADEAYGAIFFNTAASTRTFTLPSAVAGMSVCVRNLQGVAQIVRLGAGSGDYIVKSTGARTSASGEYYGATADAKNQVCVVAYDATDWYVTGEVGTWAEE